LAKCGNHDWDFLHRNILLSVFDSIIRGLDTCYRFFSWLFGSTGWTFGAEIKSTFLAWQVFGPVAGSAVGHGFISEHDLSAGRFASLVLADSGDYHY
jgi:hypothetical protein